MTEDTEPRRCQYTYSDGGECGNRARWRVVASGQVYCGRHIRHAGRVEPVKSGA